MPKLLHINCDSNWGSIGRITEQIAELAQSDGWESYIIFGRDANPSKIRRLRVGSKIGVYEHYAEYRLFDNDGLASRLATYRIVKKIALLNPDIIHLHNIHDHWLNYEILFIYLATLDIPIIWTQHDCWSFTGGCGYYSMISCEKWKTLCDRCPLKHKGILPLIDRTKSHYVKKKRLFCDVNNLILVPVSKWLENELKQSFLRCKTIRQIYNGVDVDAFRPVNSDNVREKLGLKGKRVLLAAATVWDERKGLSDYISLSYELPRNVTIVLVGLTKKQMKKLPNNVIGLQRTQHITEMVELYSLADVVLNLSYEETFGLTTVEGFACGTPGVVYNNTASPELITLETGLVVKPGDINGVLSAVSKIMNDGKHKYKDACRSRAVQFFNKQNCFRQYIELYNSVVENNR